MDNQLSKIDLGFGLSTITTVAGILAHLKFDPTVATTITALGAIATAVFGFLKARNAEKSARNSAREVADIAAKVSADNTSKTVLVETVTAERAKWRAEMREYVERLVALLESSSRGETVDWSEVDRLRTGIRLRLNPAGRLPGPAGGDRHATDRTLHALLDELMGAGAGGTLDPTLSARIEEAMATLLKGEWDKSKVEAVSGQLAGL